LTSQRAENDSLENLKLLPTPKIRPGSLRRLLGSLRRGEIAVKASDVERSDHVQILVDGSVGQG